MNDDEPMETNVENKTKLFRNVSDENKREELLRILENTLKRMRRINASMLFKGVHD